jgi:hypothetical protein
MNSDEVLYKLQWSPSQLNVSNAMTAQIQIMDEMAGCQFLPSR